MNQRYFGDPPVGARGTAGLEDISRGVEAGLRERLGHGPQLEDGHVVGVLKR